MDRNIEIKARIAAIEALTPTVAAMADEGPFAIYQDDTFFPCPAGRLKLRDFGDGSGELIFYRRADVAGPKQSSYRRSPTAEPGSLREALSLAYGVLGRIRKQRTLFKVGRTRVHLDRDEEPAQAGVLEAEHLMRELGVDSRQLVEGAYLDLSAVGAGSPSRR